MKIYTLLNRPLLLLVVLALSWAAAVPLHERRGRQTTLSGGIGHKKNPIGESLSASGTVEHSLNDKHAVFGTGGITRDKIPGLGNFDSLSVGGGYKHSIGDNTALTVSGSKNKFPNGASSIVGSAGLERGWDNNKHSLSAAAEIERHDTGFNNFNSHKAKVSYNFKPHKDATLSVGAHKSWSPFGRDTGVGVDFTYRG